MKRLERKNRAIDHVRLLADFSKRNGIREYTADALEAFSDETSRELATFVTQVDARALLVEVKAVRMKNIHAQLKLGDTYVQQLRRYADLMKTELRLAIYWDRMRTWTLNPLEAFESGSHGKKQWSIDFARAYMTSEMASLVQSQSRLQRDTERQTRWPLRRSARLAFLPPGVAEATRAATSASSRDHLESPPRKPRATASGSFPSASTAMFMARIASSGICPTRPLSASIASG
jgi:hypothetical protein